MTIRRCCAAVPVNTLVPIYIGYEHVMEVGICETARRDKEKRIAADAEGLSKLRNLGQGYVNFWRTDAAHDIT